MKRRLTPSQLAGWRPSEADDGRLRRLGHGNQATQQQPEADRDEEEADDEDGLDEEQMIAALLGDKDCGDDEDEEAADLYPAATSAVATITSPTAAAAAAATTVAAAAEPTTAEREPTHAESSGKTKAKRQKKGTTREDRLRRSFYSPEAPRPLSHVEIVGLMIDYELINKNDTAKQEEHKKKHGWGTSELRHLRGFSFVDAVASSDLLHQAVRLCLPQRSFFMSLIALFSSSLFCCFLLL